MSDVEMTTEEEFDEPEAEEQAPDEEQAQEDPNEGLKKALAAERKARREAERKAREAAAALADRDKEPEEQALEKARREALEQAQSAYNQRLIRAELKAELAGKVRNPALALKVIDTSDIEVSADGEVDSQSVRDAIQALLDEYPDLAPDGNKFQGGADQGSRGKVARPSQLTRTDIQNMSASEIEAARKAGRLNDLLGIKN